MLIDYSHKHKHQVGPRDHATTSSILIIKLGPFSSKYILITCPRHHTIIPFHPFLQPLSTSVLFHQDT